MIDQDLLPDSKNFEVDSENICHSINTIGAAETIQKLDGAFTLIWHDASDNRLHIIRNEERPFHLARCNKDWFGASEEDMLMWILKRSKSHKNRIDEHFECKVGTEYIFDMSNNSMTLVEEVAHELPVFTVINRWGSYYSNNYSQSNYQSSSKSSTSNPYDTKPGVTAADVRRRNAVVSQNKIASDRNIDIRRDMTVEITPHEFVPYATAGAVPSRGKMIGYIYDEKSQEYIEGDVHNVDIKAYQDALKDPKIVYRGTVSCISEVNAMVRLVITAGRFVDPSLEKKEPESTTADFDDDIPFDMNDSFVNKNGVTITRKFWEAHSHGDCGGCDKHIDWKDAPKAVFAYQCYWHPECLEGLTKPKDEEEEETPIGVCEICGEVKTENEFDEELSRLRGEDICKVCAVDVKKKVSNATIKDGYVWIKATDTTNARRPEFALRVTEDMIGRMTVLPSSAKQTGITLEDVVDAYVEKRSNSIFAISTKPKKEEPAEKAGVFPESRTALRKTVVSFDGNRSTDFTKAMWSTLGYCSGCFKQIPWRDAESCTLGSMNQVYCNSPKCSLNRG